MKKYALCLLACLVAMPCWAGDGMIILAGSVSFIVNPPVGWVVDTRSGALQGVNVVLYPKGQTWQNAPAVMYARVPEKEKQTFAQFIAIDEKVFQDSCPGIQIQSITIQADPQYPIQSRRFICSSGAAQNSELVSYVDAGKSFVVWVASARSKSDLERIQPAFVQLVRDAVVLQVKGK